MEETTEETTKENEKNVKVIKCNYLVHKPLHRCDFKTSRLDVLQLHIANQHYHAEHNYYIRLKLFGKYPNSCELCSDDEGGPLFNTPVDRFEHLVSQHLDFTLSLCPVCCRIFKGLTETTYHYHLKCFHSLGVVVASSSHILNPNEETKIFFKKNRLRAKNWGKKVYLPFVKLVLHMSLNRGGKPLDPVTYVNSIPEIGRDFICDLLQVAKPEVSPKVSHLTKRKRKTEPGEDTGNNKRKKTH